MRGLAEGKGPDAKVREVMTQEVMYCFDDEDIHHVCQNMAEIQVRRLPVVNRDKQQPSAIDSWMGVSNARWDGDTLVVDVTGFNGQAWLDRAGNHASSALHVVERYKFAGPDAIDYSATLEDPKTFSRAWSMHFRLVRNPEPREHLMEFKCVPFTEQLLYGEFYKRPK